MILKPQEGPQEAFLSTEADIAIYGGAAGGGKTYALLLEPLRHMNVEGYSATIFRKNATQINIDGGLLDESMSIYGFLKNAAFKASPKPHWVFGNKSKVSFMHIDGDRDLPKWQGSQICCEIETPVLMADGRYKKISEIEVGDKVMTLEGINEIVFACEPILKDCVEVELPDGQKQIQSTNHKLLTRHGWLSYDDLISLQSISNYSNQEFFGCKRNLRSVYQKLDAKIPNHSEHIEQFFVLFQDPRQLIPGLFVCRKLYEILQLLVSLPKQNCDAYKFVHMYEQIYRLFEKFLYNRNVHQQQEVERFLQAQGHRYLQENAERMLLLNLDNVYEALQHTYQDDELHILCHLFREVFQLFQDWVRHVFLIDAVFDAKPDDRISSLIANCYENCPFYFRYDDEQFLLAEDNAPTYALILNDVVLRNQNDSRFCERGIVPKRNRRILRYVHPYTGVGRITEVDHSYSTLKLTPCGKRIVRNICVNSSNHYITKAGLINKNCFIGFDELTHFCLTPEHEVLTYKGWKKISDVAVNEGVLSISLNGEIDLKRVLNTFTFDYEGELVCISQQQGISARMTPNHRIPVVKPRKKSSKNLYKFVTAKYLEKNICEAVRFGSYIKGAEIDGIVLEVAKRQNLNCLIRTKTKIPAKDWLAFLGWYISRGKTYMANKQSGAKFCVSIEQTNPSEELKLLMKRLPWVFETNNNGTYKIFSKHLYKLFEPFGEIHERRIPRYIYRLSRRQMRIFFDACVSGNEHYTKNGVVQIYIGYEKFIDDLQEMAVYLGLVSVKSLFMDDFGYKIHQLHIYRENDKLCNCVRPKDTYREHYNGKVHCLEVEDNHTFLVRHNGRIHWTGNSMNQFFYMLSRNRSICGIKPYVRATCNPDVDSWVADFISWWIDPESGYPIPERSGVLRYFCRAEGEIKWSDSAEKLAKKYGVDKELCKSVTFIASSVYDNKILLENDPSYLANLHGLSLVERERLLNGNWKIRPAAGLYFKADQVRIVKSVPDEIVAIVRAWDLAATEINLTNKDPDRTAGVLMARLKNGQYIVLDVKRLAANASSVRAVVKNTATTDKAEFRCRKILIPQDPGQAGKEQAQSYVRELSGYTVKSRPVTGNKILRAEPFAAQWQQGNVLLLEGKWNDVFLDELEGFPDALHDDQVDAASDAFSAVAYSRISSINRSEFGF